MISDPPHTTDGLWHGVRAERRSTRSVDTSDRLGYRRCMSSERANMSDLDWLRQRLVEIDDQRRALPDDDLEARFVLAQAADRCRAALRAGNHDAVAAARAAWSARAGRKGAHEQNVAALEAMARFMPGDEGAG